MILLKIHYFSKFEGFFFLNIFHGEASKELDVLSLFFLLF